MLFAEPVINVSIKPNVVGGKIYLVIIWMGSEA